MASSPDRGGFTTSLGAVLGIATTLVLGVFAALGVSGNLLGRMVRNDPRSASTILISAIIVVIIVAVITAIPQVPNWLMALPIVGLGIVLCFAANAAAVSQGKRENPSISLVLSKAQSGQLILTAKASGSSLNSNDRMLLRVTAIIRRLAVAELPGSNDNDERTELRTVTDNECKRSQLHPLNANEARLLSWTETGSDESGSASTEETMPIPPNVQYVCAWAILSPRPTDPRENAPQDFALIDLANLGTG